MRVPLSLSPSDCSFAHSLHHTLKPSAQKQTHPSSTPTNMSAAAACGLASRETVVAGRLGERSTRPSLARPCSSAPRRRRPQQRPSALAGGFLTASEPGAAGVVVQAASAVAWTGVLFMATRLFFQQQSEPEDGPRTECETCGGSGYVECWCTRWSDGDRGCSTCRGSGAMICSSCRGGGTAVPIEARLVIKRDERTSNFRQ